MRECRTVIIAGAGKCFCAGAELTEQAGPGDIPATESMGLVHSVTPVLMDSALVTARQICANNEYGVWITKRGLRANLDASSLRQAMELENRTQVLGYFSGNREEAM